MTRTETALARFNKGFHCSQSILDAFGPEFGLDPKLARRLAEPLATGSGTGGECGALSGAFLVLGLKYGSDEVDDPVTFVQFFARVGKFAEGFRARFGAVNCRELLGYNLLSQEGFEKFMAEGARESFCAKVVEFTAQRLEETLAGD